MHCDYSFSLLQFVDDKLSKKILDQARQQQEELEENHGAKRLEFVQPIL